MIPVVDIFADIVAKVAAEKHCEYMHGRRLEIINTLTAKSGSAEYKYKKYPLIALIQDIKETVNPVGRDVTLNLFIITESHVAFSAAERQVKTFEPVLYPLHDLLIKHVKRCRYFAGTNELTYDKTDVMGMYGAESNAFNDFLDAIEISNLKLSINHSC